MSHARRLRRAARKDVGEHAPAAKDPEERFAKRVAAALAELGASGAEPGDAATQLVRFGAEFSAFHEISEQDFLEQARLEYVDARARLTAAKAEQPGKGP